MSNKCNALGPKNEAEREAYALEDLVFSVQIALQKAMRKNGVSQKQLAERLGMSPARVSQIFSNGGPNLTLKTISRIAFALEEEFDFLSKRPTTESKKSDLLMIEHRISRSKTSNDWREIAGNNNRAPVLRAA